MQARTKLLKLRQELIDPWFAPPPPPLEGTVDPVLLADADSRFINVDGLRVHYKACGGDKARPALLLLHGFNGSVFNWCLDYLLQSPRCLFAPHSVCCLIFAPVVLDF